MNFHSGEKGRKEMERFWVDGEAEKEGTRVS